MATRISNPNGGVVVDFADQMGEHFSVCFGSEVMRTVPQQRVFDLLVILDDAVVDEREFAALVKMRVSILIGRLAMRRPPGVADAVSPGGRRFG